MNPNFPDGHLDILASFIVRTKTVLNPLQVSESSSRECKVRREKITQDSGAAL
jgi:hypothetical protein